MSGNQECLNEVVTISHTIRVIADAMKKKHYHCDPRECSGLIFAERLAAAIVDHPDPEPEALIAGEFFTLADGSRLVVHSSKECAGRNCCIHNPSDHPLKDAPLNWRPDRGIMERICKHGVGHDDPDDLAYREMTGREASGTHGCCGCCARPFL